MAEDRIPHDSSLPAENDEPTRLPDWSRIWQFPVLLLGLVLFVLGLIMAMPTRQGADFSDTLDSAEAWIDPERLSWVSPGRRVQQQFKQLEQERCLYLI